MGASLATIIAHRTAGVVLAASTGGRVWTIWFDGGRQGMARFDEAALVLERTVEDDDGKAS
ncbi:MAG: hypothetical protein KIT25_09675 [Enhydrobacter sp.]|nr:MAG: hypothetical protein KIT25_09675 [Enhydrobacter sp.]